ncbi:MAG: DUF3795 domain-containing protein [Candidatus Heimdallarchaeota archaeon]
MIKEQIGFCGHKCIDCGIKQSLVTDSVDDLVSVLKTTYLYNQLHEFSDQEPVFKHEENFYSFLQALKQHFGSCKGCSEKSGISLCAIRNCAIERNVSLCSDCPDFDTCEKIQNDFLALENLADLK